MVSLHGIYKLLCEDRAEGILGKAGYLGEGLPALTLTLLPKRNTSRAEVHWGLQWSLFSSNYKVESRGGMQGKERR